jgi:hypothetical protein
MSCVLRRPHPLTLALKLQRRRKGEFVESRNSYSQFLIYAVGVQVQVFSAVVRLHQQPGKTLGCVVGAKVFN